MDYTPFFITFKLALLTTMILFNIAIPLAYFLAFTKLKIKVLLESLVMLPIVLPPTVLGFYFLIYLGPNSVIGAFFEKTFGLSFAFTFEGILLGAVIFCLPFMVTPIMTGFRSIPKNTIEATKILNKTKWNALIYVFLPTIKKSIMNGILLTFAHTIGAFGIILMIGGKMADTNVAAVAIYDEMNKMNYDAVHTYALVLLFVSFVAILLLNIFAKPKNSDIAPY
ncbi:molybdate ABC transporter permease subunit [Crocinitomix catalasitica]|uniref:molybdate ABC transporter permease subunit n=1 Tax=Crocinitomix catalasitica TaxID=184607 RepID=UPI000482594A|nr:molybdate ABC transporter permease subunit [Crocinitomix catalasitica]